MKRPGGFDEEADPPRSLAGRVQGTLERVTRTSGSREADPVREAERRVRSAERDARRSQRREQRRFSASSRRRWRNGAIVGGAVLALALFVGIGVFTPVMSVQEITVAGTVQVEEAAVVESLAELRGTPLALVSTNDVQQRLEEFPVIQRFALELVPPGTMIVRIEERDPVVSLRDGDHVRLVDAAGVEVGSAESAPPGVPLATERVTDTKSAAFSESAVVLRDLPQGVRERIASVAATGALDIRFTLHDGTEVFWGTREETQRKAIILEQMLVALQDRDVSHIDVSSISAPVFR